MDREFLSINWMPKSHEEFRQMANAGRVDLSILDNQYTWLYAQVIPYSPFTINYKKKLLKKMIADATVFKKVHDKGIDLLLLKEK